MNLAELKNIKIDKRGPTYDCGKVKLLIRKKGSICADHIHKFQETFYLIKGETELTVGNETKIVKSPIRIIIQPGEYHKFLALSDMELIEDRNGEVAL